MGTTQGYCRGRGEGRIFRLLKVNKKTDTHKLVNRHNKQCMGPTLRVLWEDGRGKDNYRLLEVTSNQNTHKNVQPLAHSVDRGGRVLEPDIIYSSNTHLPLNLNRGGWKNSSIENSSLL